MSTTNEIQSTRDQSSARHIGPYVLHNILSGVPLSEDGSDKDIFITCAEFWSGNLYIGTSAAEILHYVLIPAGAGPDEKEQFILATRLALSAPDGAIPAGTQMGVHQIVTLPSVGKACIVCNGHTTFYTLPELSPIFTTTKLGNCSFVGGLDLDESPDEAMHSDGVVIMICQKSKTRLVRVGDRLRAVRDIELGSCSAIARRGNVACIADSRAYSLLDVVERQQIPLSDIVSSTEEPESPSTGAGADTPTQFPDAPTAEQMNTSSLSVPAANEDDRSRSISPASDEKKQHDDDDEAPATEFPPRASSLSVPRSSSKSSQRRSRSPNGKSVAEAVSNSNSHAPKPKRTPQRLPPHIASPTPTEFLFTTGTSADEPGVGMYVNLDGDVTRGTLEFSRYPQALCLDLWNSDLPMTPGADVADPEGFVIAVVTQVQGESTIASLEIQRWNPDSSDASSGKHWLDVEDSDLEQPGQNMSLTKLGVRSTISPSEITSPDIGAILGLTRLTLPTNQRSDDVGGKSKSSQSGADRAKTEAQFITRLSSIRGKVLVWKRDRVWWAVRNPPLVRLDNQLSLAIKHDASEDQSTLDRHIIRKTLQEVNEKEPQTELDFLGFKLIRQRASLLLFADVVADFLSKKSNNDGAVQLAEETLFESEVDPRIVLAILPVLKDEVVESQSGIWVPNGIKSIVEDFLSVHDLDRQLDPSQPLDAAMLHLAKRFLQLWRRKKGFGSIADEAEVFFSVDAALLHTLLILDSQSPKGRGSKGSIRSELNTFVDHPVDCGEHAVELLESYKRLYVLSRLYQGRKLPAKVLATWRRIIEGEEDAGGQLRDGEQEVGRYLLRINDPSVVEEYGTWLATRNPVLGVRVFADNNSKVKFAPAKAVEILKQRAPNAVKDYLEYLVFDKNFLTYANDLISHYLDLLLTTLSTSPAARSTLLETYSSYRALDSPKPPYSIFAADNAPPSEPWYTNRLRLLQLLGGSSGVYGAINSVYEYDVKAVLTRVEPFEDLLVPEMIVLRGRQGRHAEAIRLLTHGLGDFDTAVSYCVLGGGVAGAATGAGVLPPFGFTGSDITTATTSTSSTEVTLTQQQPLFTTLLHSFLSIPTSSTRRTQTLSLLSRFAPWFDTLDVLALVPEEWTVQDLEPFLESSVRKVVGERRETAVKRALVSVENLEVVGVLGEKITGFGGRVEVGVRGEVVVPVGGGEG